MRKKTRLVKRIPALLAAVLLAVSVLPAYVSADTETDEPEEWVYEHDPMENPVAAADIVVNPDAVYGYSPNPDSKRLGPYASYDWSDKEVVEKDVNDSGNKENEELINNNSKQEFESYYDNNNDVINFFIFSIIFSFNFNYLMLLFLLFPSELVYLSLFQQTRIPS